MVYDDETVVVGTRKTLVFYIGRAPNGMKTSWVMHEFRLHNPHIPPAKEDWVLCRVFDKTKRETSDARYYGLMEGSINGGDEEQLDNYYCNIINRNPNINTAASSFPLVDPYLQPQCMSINIDMMMMIITSGTTATSLLQLLVKIRILIHGRARS